TQGAVLIYRDHRAWFERCIGIHVELLGAIGASQQDIARYGDVLRYSHISVDYNSSLKQPGGRRGGLDGDALRAARVDAPAGGAVREDCCIARRGGFDGDALRAARVDATSGVAVREDRCIARRGSFDSDTLRAARVDAASGVAVREDRCITRCGSFDSDALRAA